MLRALLCPKLPIDALRSAALSLGAVLLAAGGCYPDTGVRAFNANPEATITSHSDGSTALEAVTTSVRGAVSDPDDGADELMATWYVDQEEACAPAAPDSSGITQCDLILDKGEVEIVLEVQDGRGAAGQDTVVIEVEPNQAPEVEIVQPADGASFYADQKITFEGLLSDAEDPSDSLVASWSSDAEGALEKVKAIPDSSGNVLGVGYLSEGGHVLTLSATDSVGKTGLATVSIEVGPPNSPPSCGITAPADGSSGAAGATVVFTGTASDPDVSPDVLSVSWTSDKDGLLGEMTPDSDGLISFPFGGLSADTHDITLRVEDEVGEGCTDSVLYSVGEAPSVVIDSPAPASTVNEGSSTVFTATISDDDPPSSLSLEWVSDVDGVLSTAPADGSGVATFASSVLSAGLHTVTLTAVDPTGLIGNASVSFTVNAVPTAPTVEISPDPAVTTDDLVAVASGSIDPDASGPISYTWAWYEDGSLSGVSTTDTFPAASTVKGRSYKAVATPSDGIGSGTPGEDEVAVDNTPPVLGSITIDPPSGVGVTASLSCLASATDADGDTPSLSYAWENITAGTSLGSSDAITLSPSSAALGDEIRCTVTATDDTGATDVGSASVTIDNIPPTVDSIAIDPASGVTTSTVLSCLATASDPDGGSPTLSYAWTETGSGAVLGTSDVLSLDPSFVQPGDVVECTATATDSGGGTDSSSTSVTVENTDPTVDSVAISPSSGVGTSTTLSCTASASDADGGIPTLDYAWEDLTTGAPLGSGSVLSLDPALVSPGDEIQCTATATDADGGSDSRTDTVSVGNSVPSVASASITPDPAYAGDTLVCSWSGFSDADGDPDLSQVEWFIGGVSAGSTATLAGGFVGGDSIECVVTPYDGFDSGAPVSATLTVDNSAPVLAEVSLSPDPGHEDDLLVCTPGSTTDADGTTVFSYTYEWKVGGATVAETGSSLDDSYFTRGDSVWCIVTPSDGTDSGAAVESNIVPIENSPPVVDTISISPSPASADDVLSCSWTGFYDADGDPDFTTVEWFVNSASAGSSTVLSSGFAGGDLVECVVTPFDGLDEGSPRTTSTVIGNSPPTVDSVFITPEPAYAGDTLTCGWSGFDDADGDPDSSFAQWTVNGVSAGTSTTLVYPLVGGDVVECSVTPFDGGTYGTPVATSLTVSNSLPELASVSLSPDPAREADLLGCVPGSVSDADGTSSFTFAYSWRVDGAAIGHTGDSLDGTWFDKGQTVSCTVVPNDGTEDGAPVDSPTISVENSPPSIASVSITPDPAEPTDVLTCSYTGFADDDGDGDLSTLSWEVNGSPAGSGNTLSSGFRGGDLVSCIASPFDGEDLGTPVQYDLTVINNPPEMISVFLSPESPHTDSDLTVSATANDPDGDPITYSYTWYVNSSPVGATGATLEGSTWFDKHDSVFVVVTPNDGVDDGGSMTTDTIEVVNSVPTTPTLSIEPAGAIELLDDLVCTVVTPGDDLDGDALVHEVSWTVDGLPWKGPVTSTYEPGDTVYAEDTYAGTWECSAASYDGEAYGPISSASTEVGICADQYLVFDGLDDYVDLGSGDNLFNITNEFTITAWMYKDDGSGEGTIVDFEASRSTTAEENAGIKFWVNDRDKLKAFYGTGYDTYYQSEGWTIASVPRDEWVHVAMVRSDRNITMYFNGDVEYNYDFLEPEDVNFDGAALETDQYQIGRYEVDPTSVDPDLMVQHFFSGTIAHVGVWSRALDGTEIDLAAAAADLDASLVADAEGYWPLTEGTGTAVYDASGNGHDGVVVGASWVGPCPSLWP